MKYQKEWFDLAKMLVGKTYGVNKVTVTGQPHLPHFPEWVEVQGSTPYTAVIPLWRLLHLIEVPDILAVVDVKKAIGVWEETKQIARHNSMERWQGKYLPFGTWRCDPMTGEFEVLVPLPVSELVTTELESACKYRADYKQYVSWAKEGHKPPPTTVVRHVRGHLVACNSRRFLAAKRAGVQHLVSWFSESRSKYPWHPFYGGICQWQYKPISSTWKAQYAMKMERICRRVEPRNVG